MLRRLSLPPVPPKGGGVHHDKSSLTRSYDLQSQSVLEEVAYCSDKVVHLRTQRRMEHTNTSRLRPWLPRHLDGGLSRRAMTAAAFTFEGGIV